MSPLLGELTQESRHASALDVSELPSPREAPVEGPVAVEPPVSSRSVWEEEDWKQSLRTLDSEVHWLEEELRQTRARSSGTHELSAMWIQSADDLAKWNDTLWTGLGDLRYQVKMLQRSKHFDYAKIKGPQDHLEAVRKEEAPPVRKKAVGLRISTFRARMGQEFETLLEEQETLEASLRKLQRGFKTWEEPGLFALEGLPRERSPRSSPRSDPKRPDSLVPEDAAGLPTSKDAELLALEEELKALDAEGGREGTGGWPIASHEIFVRILRACRMKATPQCYARLERQFPDISQAELAEHLRFCTAQEARQAKRRLILTRWRQRRGVLKMQGEHIEETCDKALRGKTPKPLKARPMWRRAGGRG